MRNVKVKAFLEPQNVTRFLMLALKNAGVTHAWGVSGGAIGAVMSEMIGSDIRLIHARHETSALFQATEASLASGKPALAYVTTGPGFLNALNGVAAAKWDGAKVVLISAASAASARGRWAVQETSPYTMPSCLSDSKTLFDYSVCVQDPAELHEIHARLQQGFSRKQGFVAHISIPVDLALADVDSMKMPHLHIENTPEIHKKDLQEIAGRLSSEKTVLWVGYGASHAAKEVLLLAEKMQIPVMVTPRAKGVFPEKHALYLGVTGAGGHEEVMEYFMQEKPETVLVLGTKMGEASSFWDARLVPSKGFIHIDVQSEVFGAAYPKANTDGYTAEIKGFLGRVLTELFAHSPSPKVHSFPKLRTVPVLEPERSPIRHAVLMAQIQQEIVEKSEAIVMSDAGNAFGFANHYLRFSEAFRYRTSPLWGTMGQMSAGVIGAAEMSGKKAVAIVGDGAFLMNNELNTAAQHQINAVWIVLNDGKYGIVAQGAKACGWKTADTADLPKVDFVAYANSLGVTAVKVEKEGEIADALKKALAYKGPFVVDVSMVQDAVSPAIEGRMKTFAAAQQNED